MPVLRLVRARVLHCSCANRLLAMPVPCLLVIDDARARVTRDRDADSQSQFATLAQNRHDSMWRNGDWAEGEMSPPLSAQSYQLSEDRGQKAEGS